VPAIPHPGHDFAQVSGYTRRRVTDESEGSVGAQERGISGDEELHDVPAEIREVSFPLALRGYSCEVVDAYVDSVNRVIADLEVRRSPRAAVRQALDRVGEQVGGILQRAREAAEEITSAAHQEAEEIAAWAKAEAAELVVQASAQADRERMQAQKTLAQARAAAESAVKQANAEAAETRHRAEEELTALQEQAQARLAELRSDTDVVWSERLRLLDNTRETAARLDAIATKAAMQFARTESQPKPEQAAVVAVEPGGDVAAKRRPRAGAAGEAAPAKGRNGTSPRGR
jgi:DivIVA domain-containing protein